MQDFSAWSGEKATRGVLLVIVDGGDSSAMCRRTLVPAEGLEAGYIGQLQVVMEAIFPPIHKTDHRDTNNGCMRAPQLAPGPQDPAAESEILTSAPGFPTQVVRYPLQTGHRPSIQQSLEENRRRPLMKT